MSLAHKDSTNGQFSDPRYGLDESHDWYEPETGEPTIWSGLPEMPADNENDDSLLDPEFELTYWSSFLIDDMDDHPYADFDAWDGYERVSHNTEAWLEQRYGDVIALNDERGFSPIVSSLADDCESRSSGPCQQPMRAGDNKWFRREQASKRGLGPQRAPKWQFFAGRRRGCGRIKLTDLN